MSSYFGTPQEIEAARAKRRKEIQEHSRQLMEEALQLKLNGNHMITGIDPKPEPLPEVPVVIEKPVSRPAAKNVDPDLESVSEITVTGPEPTEKPEVEETESPESETVEEKVETKKTTPKASKSTSKEEVDPK